MKKKTSDEDRLVQYLLGQVPQEERTQIEERYLADPDFHEELSATERDLIDQYVRGELAEREQFEKCFLSSPRRRAKVEFARALMKSLARTPAAAVTPVFSQARVPWWVSSLRFLDARRPVMIAAAIAIVVLAGGWLMTRGGPGNQLAQTPQQQQPPPVSLPAPPPQPPPQPQPPPARVATFLLTPSLVRSEGDDTTTVTIEENVLVSLQLPIETADFKTYQAVVRTADGREVWRQTRLTPRTISSGQVIVVDPPAVRFRAGDYTVKLNGVGAGEPEEVSNYWFRLVKKPTPR